MRRSKPYSLQFSSFLETKSKLYSGGKGIYAIKLYLSGSSLRRDATLRSDLLALKRKRRVLNDFQI